MARTSSALKANRAARAKTNRNRHRLATIDKLIRQTKRATTPDPEVTVALQRAIDKAATRGVIHANRAARLKSRLLGLRQTTALPVRTTKTKKTTPRKTKKSTKK